MKSLPAPYNLPDHRASDAEMVQANDAYALSHIERNPARAFDQDDAETAAIAWAHVGGSVWTGSALVTTPASSEVGGAPVDLAPSAINYVEINVATGALAVQQSGWRAYPWRPIRRLVTDSGTILTNVDMRAAWMASPGDMAKAVYDTDADGIVDDAEHAAEAEHADEADHATAADSATTAGTAMAAPWSGISGKPSTFPPSSHTHTASEVTDFDTQVRTNRLDQMAQPTADLNLNARKLTNAADGVAATDLATVGQVDAARSGMNYKEAVRASSSINHALTGEQTVDGVACVAGDRVLLKAQTDASENGIWVVAVGAWARSADANVSAEVQPGMTCWVSEGTVNGDKRWSLSTNAPITLGTTGLTFVQSGTSGGVSDVTASGGVASSGGATPNITLNLPGLTDEPAPADADTVPAYDASASAHRSFTLLNLAGYFKTYLLGVVMNWTAQHTFSLVPYIASSTKTLLTASTATATIYVDPTSGNDSTGTGASGAPYLTIQKALDALPRYLQHSVIIAVAKGTTTGGIDLSGISCGPNVSITIEAKDTSGNALYTDGLATSGSTTTIVKTSSGWTTNAWANAKVFCFQGAGAGQSAVVTSNTSDTLTFPAVTTAFDNTSRFVICGLVKFDRSGLSTATVGNMVRALTVAGMWFDNTSSTREFDLGGSAATVQANLVVTHCYFSPSLTSNIGVMANNLTIASVNRCYFSVPATGTGISVLGKSHATITRCAFVGQSLSTNTGISADRLSYINMSVTLGQLCIIKGVGTAINLGTDARGVNLTGQVLSGNTANYANAMGQISAYISVTANRTFAASDHWVDFDSTAASRTATLPDATQFPPGTEFIAWKPVSANSLIIAVTSSQLINGAAASGFTLTGAGTGWRFKNTGSGWDATYLSATGIGPVFVASGASHAAGAVPDPGVTSGTTKFLREDATWQVPAGGGGSSTGGDIYLANNYI